MAFDTYIPDGMRCHQVAFKFRLPTDLLGEGPSGVIGASSDGIIVSHRGQIFEVPPDMAIGPSLASGRYEEVESQLIKQYIRPGDVTIDVGANVGYYTVLMRKAVGATGKVIAIEPFPPNVASLVRNLEANGAAGVDVYQCAAGASRESVNLYLDRANAGDHRAWHVPGRKFISVPSLPLDEIVGGRRVDFLKIDVQGQECGVLRGAIRVLKNSSMLAMAVEF